MSTPDEREKPILPIPIRPTRQPGFADSRSSDRQDRIVAWIVIFGALALAVLMTAGVLASRAWQRGKADAATLGRPVLQARVDGAGAAPRPVEPQAEPAAAVVQETVVIGDGPAVQVQEGVVKFYFATGKADLAEGAKEALADIVRGVAAGQTAVVSGFHDATGNAAFNAELAKKRAEAVRAALLELGVGEDKVTLQKPEAAEANASGSDAAARRVEVRLQ